MIDIVFQADGVLQKTGNLGDELRLRVVGAMVHPDMNFQIIADSNLGQGIQLLSGYQRWLGQGKAARGPDQLTSSEVCLNHLMSHTGLSGVLGVAIQASPDIGVVGGLCESRVISGNALNVGITSTLSTLNGDVPMWQTVLSTTHEVSRGAIENAGRCVLIRCRRSCTIPQQRKPLPLSSVTPPHKHSSDTTSGLAIHARSIQTPETSYHATLPSETTPAIPALSR
jgi:hypothetical protein